MAATVRDVQNLQTTVVALQGNPVFPAVPNVGDGLIWTGGDWRNYPVASPGNIAGGPFLPIVGGEVTGNLTVDGTLSAAQTLEMTGNSGIINATGAEGGVSLQLTNTFGLNGAAFTNNQLDLVDFAFKGGPSGTFGSMRFEARGIPNGQFQFMLGGAPVVYIDANGNITSNNMVLAQSYQTYIPAGNAGAGLPWFTWQDPTTQDLYFSTSAIGNPPLIAFNRSGGIDGVTNGSNAVAGVVGEFLSVVVPSTSGVTLTDGATTVVASLPLTPGDWDVGGELWVAMGTPPPGLIAGTITAGTTFPAEPEIAASRIQSYAINTTGGGGVSIYSLAPARFPVSTSTTVNLLGLQTGSSGTNTGYGKITARRVR